MRTGGDDMTTAAKELMPPSWAGMLELRIMSINGDDRLAWDASDLAQLKEARAKFYELLDLGYLAFHVDDESGEPTNEMIAEFDPWCEEVLFKKPSDAKTKKSKVVMVPPVQAG
jgi:hypothetical protein